MNAFNNLNAAWRPVAALMSPLEAVRLAADSLERGEVTPPAAAAILGRALRQYLAGHLDITDNLGLRPRRGGAHEVPGTKERRARRDAGIQQLYDAQTGCKAARARKVATLLATSPDANTVTEADVLRYVMDLHTEFGGELPTSMRQILRLTTGKA